MSQQPTQATAGHAVCVRCHPELDGPAPVNAAPVAGTCPECAGLAFVPCRVCQSETWDLWARIMTADDAELVAAHLARMAECGCDLGDNEHTKDCGG